jgi:uncharacterized protein
MLFELALFTTSILAAAIASVTGFGIGSLITPVISLTVGTKLAVALVAIPHLVATTIRFWMLRKYVNRKALISFGLLSAAGGLLGALLHAYFPTPALTLIFGSILIFAGFTGATGLSDKMRFHGRMAWAAGATSGLLGGMVGNQGGIRAAAMMGFRLTKESFVATATAIGLFVDLARMPIYFWSEAEGILQNGRWVSISVLGVVLGTLGGAKLLKQIPERSFRRIVSSIILVLGLFMVYQAT